MHLQGDLKPTCVTGVDDNHIVHVALAGVRPESVTANGEESDENNDVSDHVCEDVLEKKRTLAIESTTG